MTKNRPKLGQHFLKNRTALKTIVDALVLKKSDIVIEIGPGQGALTIPLAERCAEIGCTVTAVEKDEELVNLLNSELVNWTKTVTIIHGDILKIISNLVLKFEIGNWKLVGNIPYYLTGKLLRTISELEQKPERIVFTIQKEVAERITAQPPKMNLLAAATQVWAEPKILMSLKPGDFTPQPEVHSAVIELVPRMMLKNRSEYEKYYALIKILFKQPRKTIWNNLRSGIQLPEPALKELLKTHNISPDLRPQDISYPLLIKLAKAKALNVI